MAIPKITGVNIPLVGGWKFEEKLNSAGTMIGVNEEDLRAINEKRGG